MDSNIDEPTWDAFISYAYEDRATVAQPLADALVRAGVRIWYDQTELKVGDSLRERVDAGLAPSRFGIVILSPSFFRKHYPIRELNGLASREIDGEKVILPVWRHWTGRGRLPASPWCATCGLVLRAWNNGSSSMDTRSHNRMPNEDPRVKLWVLVSG